MVRVTDSFARHELVLQIDGHNFGDFNGVVQLLQWAHQSQRCVASSRIGDAPKLLHNYRGGHPLLAFAREMPPFTRPLA